MTQAPVPGLSGGEAVRLGNQINQARQAAMGGNAAAANSIRPMVSGRHVRPRSQVSGYQDNGGMQQPSPLSALQGSPAQAPVQNTGATSAMAQPMQPENPVDRYNRDQALDHILSSPEMMDTVTRLKLRNHYKGRSDDGIGSEALQMLQGHQH